MCQPMLAHPCASVSAPDKNITRHFAVTGALRPDDFAAVAAWASRPFSPTGLTGNRAAPLTSRQEAELAAKAGLGLRHIPVTKQNAFDEVVIDAMMDAAGTPRGAHSGPLRIGVAVSRSMGRRRRAQPASRLYPPEATRCRFRSCSDPRRTRRAGSTRAIDVSPTCAGCGMRAQRLVCLHWRQPLRAVSDLTA